MAKTSVLEAFMGHAKRSYSKVYKEFERIGQMENATVLPALSGQCFDVRKSGSHPNEIEVHGGLRIERLSHTRKALAEQAKPQRTTDSIQVLMDSLDIYKFKGSNPKLEESFLYKSNVRLSYYKVANKGQQWKPIVSIRYDFDKAHDAHPIFHVQFEDGTIKGDRQRIFRSLPEIDGASTIHTGIRIPSANMVGATALLQLAADHFPMEKFSQMLGVIQTQSFFSDWRCDFSSLDHADAARGMLSSGWYSKHVPAAARAAKAVRAQ